MRKQLQIFFTSLFFSLLGAKFQLDKALTKKLIISFTATCTAALSIAFPSYCSLPSLNKYDQYSSSYNVLNGGSLSKFLGLDDLRKNIASGLHGDILEVAIGTGLQLPYYDWSKINSFVAIDSSKEMLNIASQTLDNIFSRKYPFQVAFTYHVEVADIESTKFKDNEFDFVVDTFSMCVFEDPKKALSEMKRVVKPNGRIVLLENSRSTFPPLGFLQDVFEPIVTPLAKNCKWNVDVPAIAASLDLVQVQGSEQQLGTIFQGSFIKKDN